ncbi:MAG: bifunctional riboflavin kinase/FAD synthetase [Wenzhouxiangellaceae bacterium]|nr:bifunctional riboflavin kinase/FAD synthetase [Wenzhouxiangellaceae bacterium]
MQLIRHLPARLKNPRPLAVTIGNFDGLHLGHQALVKHATACKPDLQPALMCFEPLPRTFFCPQTPVPRVMKLRDKIKICRRLGLEVLIQQKFDRGFSELTPEQFARDVLVRDCRAARVVIGADFRFGHKAAGDADALARFGRRFGFATEVVEVVTVGGNDQPASSSRLRCALADGDLRLAVQLLGRPYSISGRVIRGQQLGRKLGYSTANLRVAEPPALHGVLAVSVSGDGLQAWPGVASIGMRPTVAGRDWLLEVHLFDYAGDLYGSHLDVEFVDYIRPELHFESLAAMTEQMHRDAAQARAALHAD